MDVISHHSAGSMTGNNDARQLPQAQLDAHVQSNVWQPAHSVEFLTSGTDTPASTNGIGAPTRTTTRAAVDKIEFFMIKRSEY